MIQINAINMWTDEHSEVVAFFAFNIVAGKNKCSCHDMQDMGFFVAIFGFGLQFMIKM